MLEKTELLRLEIAIHRVGERMIAPVAAVVIAFHAQKHQLLGILHRHQPQQYLIEQAKDGSVCADAEGQ